MSATIDKIPVTRTELREELQSWATEIKGSFNAVEDRLDEHTKILSEHTHILSEHSRRLASIEKTLDEHTTILTEIASTLRSINTELKSFTGLYRRLDHRDHVFASKLGVDLRKVDAEG